MRSQRGYTLVELLVGAAIAFVAGWVLVRLCRDAAVWAARTDARLNARSAADRLAERLASDAAGAWSVFVPPADVFGAPNGDGHELDFATEDGTHTTYRWAYDFNAAAARVTAYAYATGLPPSPGATFDGITAFSAASHPVNDLSDPAGDAYDALFAGSTLVPVDVPFDWGGAATGGNRLVRVRVTAPGIDRAFFVASGTAPSHFTVIVDYTPPPATPTP